MALATAAAGAVRAVMSAGARPCGFMVHRTPLGYLPVYLEVRRETSKYQSVEATVIRGLEGNVTQLVDELRNELGELDVLSRAGGDSLVLWGNYMDECTEYLLRRGF
ncbi:Mitochondrial large subunit ribosomal protein (Img2) [Plasmodiophora brassicae]|uniref:Uncharacterized protein n=1 Tax=Plasmodiophora brassicae TaxID=37360 RepID=A0A0G4IRH5_PLABS|nr:hypothetical protein PBRA_006097 [Plasmodiophora brassicae]SPQ98197.1 unnamed protein product [Plasmodiophora brassicae]